MAKPRTLVTASALSVTRRLPSEKEIFDTGDMLSFVFDRPEAAALKKRFLEDAEAYWDWLRLQHAADARGIAYLIHLILRCPQLLTQRPPESEWIMRELGEFLVQRTVDPRQDGAFWKALELVRKGMRLGRPRDRALDFFRYSFIQNLMYPPRQLESVVETFKKTNAVNQLAEAEQQLFERSPDTRAIWRSYKRVDQFLRQTAARMQAESSLSPPPTKQLDSEPKETPKKSKKRMTQSQHQKRVRRK